MKREVIIIKWTIEDIKNVKPEWSDDKCEEFLSSIEDGLQDKCIEAGNNYIDWCIANEPDKQL
jgi:hypothetical protein